MSFLDDIGRKIAKVFDKKRDDFEPGGKMERLYPLFEAKETFLFILGHKSGDDEVHIRDAIDTAFLRRIRFLVEFPFPDKALRREIWIYLLLAAIGLTLVEWLTYNRRVTV